MSTARVTPLVWAVRLSALTPAMGMAFSSSMVLMEYVSFRRSSSLRSGSVTGSPVSP